MEIPDTVSDQKQLEEVRDIKGAVKLDWPILKKECNICGEIRLTGLCNACKDCCGCMYHDDRDDA